MFGLANRLGAALRTLSQRVRSLFSRVGAGNAHAYMFGVGTVQGFTAGNYVESTGVTPASVDQPCGLVLDAAGSVSSTEVWNTSSVGFSGESSQVSSGVYRIYSSAGTYSAASSGTLVVGKTYRAELTIDSVTAAGGGLLLDGLGAQAVPASVGRKSFILVANLTSFAVKRSAGATDIQISGVSVREITGIHASQSTSGFRPVERRGIVNLLTYSNDLTNAAWSKFNASVSVSKLIPNTTSSAHSVNQGTVTSGVPCTIAVVAESAGYDFINIKVVGGLTRRVFDLANASAGVSGGSVGNTASILTLPNGSKLCVISFTPTASTGIYVGVQSANTDDQAFAGDGTAGVNIYGIGLFQGTLTASQILAMGGIPTTTTAAASSSLGPGYLQFDGTDDRLTLGSVPFQMSDDHCVVVAATPLSDNRSIVSVDNAGFNLQYCARIRVASGAVIADWRDNAGIVSTLLTNGTVYVGSTIIVSAIKRGNYQYLRVNGVAIGSNNIALGATTLANAQIGSYVGGTPNYHNGPIYAAFLIKGTLSDAEITLLEKQAASLAGIQL